MKCFLAGLVLATPFLGSAQQLEQALLWRISGNGLERPGYIYGTVHSKDDRAYTYVTAVKDAMQQVNTVAGELDLDASRKGAASLMSRMLMPDDQRLEDLYKKKDWAKVDAFLKTELGFMAVMVQRMKPFFVMATLTEKAMGGKREMVLDEYLMSHAKASAHRTIGLETLDEQLRAMDVLPLKEQAAMLLDHVTGNTAHELLDSMLDAYAEQDIDALMHISQKSGSMPEKMERALLTDRNVVLTHRLDSVLRSDGSTMLLVGAAHLPGDAGILQLLRAKGYSMEAVAIEAGTAALSKTSFPPPMLLSEGIRYTNDTLGYSVDMPGVPENVGDNRIGFKQNGSGVLVIVDERSGDLSGTDVAKVIAEHYGDAGVGTARTIAVQGIEAQVFSMDMKGTPAEIVVVQHGLRTFFVAALDSDGDIRKNVLDSFRLTDLPE